MQRRHFASPSHTPPLLSVDLACNDEDDPDESPAWLRSGGLVLGSITVGVVLALVCHYSGLRQWSGGLSWAAFAAPSTQSGNKPEDQLALIIGELATLKKSISHFGAGQQQIKNSIAALQAGQQDLQQRISSIQTSSHWYSDAAALRLRFAIQQKPATVASASRAPEPVARRGESGPLPLLGPTH